MIHEQRYNWMRMNYPEPDTIIMSVVAYRGFIKYLNEMMIFGTEIMLDGKHKYMGMDLIYSPNLEDNDIRVCKTKVI